MSAVSISDRKIVAEVVQVGLDPLPAEEDQLLDRNGHVPIVPRLVPGDAGRREQRRRGDLLDRQTQIALDRREGRAERFVDLGWQRADVARARCREHALGLPAAVLPRRRGRRIAVRRPSHHVQQQLRVLDARRERPLRRVPPSTRGSAGARSTRRSASGPPGRRTRRAFGSSRRRRSRVASGTRPAASAAAGSTRRATRRPLESPRVPRRAEDVVVGPSLERELGHVRPAEHDRARRDHPLDGDLAPLGGRPVEHRPRAEVRDLTDDVGVVLDQEREAGERALGAALVERRGRPPPPPPATAPSPRSAPGSAVRSERSTRSPARPRQHGVRERPVPAERASIDPGS